MQKGKVVAETGNASVAIDAGRKAVIHAGQQHRGGGRRPHGGRSHQNPAVGRAGEAGPARANRQFQRSDDQDSRPRADSRLPICERCPTRNPRPSSTCRIAAVSILDNPLFYDLQGNRLSVDVEKINARTADYFVRFPAPVEPGKAFPVHLRERARRLHVEGGPVVAPPGRLECPVLPELLSFRPAPVGGIRRLQLATGRDRQLRRRRGRDHSQLHRRHWPTASAISRSCGPRRTARPSRICRRSIGVCATNTIRTSSAPGSSSLRRSSRESRTTIRAIPWPAWPPWPARSFRRTNLSC